MGIRGATPVLSLSQALERDRSGLGRTRTKRSHKVPLLDFSQIGGPLYGTGDGGMRDAALQSLNASVLSARMPHTARPLSRELPHPLLFGAQAATSTHAQTARPRNGGPGLDAHGMTETIALPLGGAGKLPAGWAARCVMREEAVERLTNLALRLQSYTRSGGGMALIPVSVRGAIAEGFGALRAASLLLVEDLVTWQAQARALELLREAQRKAAEKKFEERREMHAASVAAFGGIKAAATQPRLLPPKRHRARPLAPPQDHRGKDRSSGLATDASRAKMTAAAKDAEHGLAPAEVHQGRRQSLRAFSDRHESSRTMAGLNAQEAAAESRTASGVREINELRPDLVRDLAIKRGCPKARFTNYALSWATAAAHDLKRPREATGLWSGLDYVLKAMTDVWRLPMPTATDPFGLRWFRGDPQLSAEATNGAESVPRMMAAETALKRLLSRDELLAMSALEVSTGLRMAAAQQVTTPSMAAASVDVHTQAADWRTLALVMYLHGAAGYNAAKRRQWRHEQGVIKLQMAHRRRLFHRRVVQRETSREEAAARVVQFYFRQKLRVGAGGRMLALAAEENQRRRCEEDAERRAKRRVEAMRVEQERLAFMERKDKQERRARQMARALKQLAAVECVQRVARGFLARLELKRLIQRRALFLLGLQADQTGLPMRLVIKFQRRVRQWLSTNELMLNLYEDHRLFLYAQRSQPEMELLQTFLMEREAALKVQTARFHVELAQLEEAPRAHFAARLRLHRAQGEAEGLEVSATQAPLEGRSSELISKARKEMATLASEIERVTKQCGAAEQERRVLLAQASACEGAAELAAQVTDAHHIVIPLLLGQTGLLKAQSEMSQKAFTKMSDYLDELWEKIDKLSDKLVRSEANARPEQGKERKERLMRIEEKLPRLREELEAAQPDMDTWGRLHAELARAQGAHRLLCALTQRHQYLDWQDVRAKRVLALTFLKVTRAAGKRNNQLALRVATLRGREELLKHVGRHTTTPPCSLTLRPGLPKKLPQMGGTAATGSAHELTASELNESIRTCLLADLAQAARCDAQRLAVSRQGHQVNDPDDPFDDHLGIELLVSSGMCDVTIEISHVEEETQHDTPEALLMWILRALPYGELPSPRLNQSLGLPPNARGMEWTVLSHEAPDTARVNVRRELQEELARVGAAEKAASAALKEGREAKLAAEATAFDGQKLPSSKALKLAAKRGQGRLAQVEMLVNDLPSREESGTDNEQALQFDWLPNQIHDARNELVSELEAPEEELRRLRGAMVVRREGKDLLLWSQRHMASLRDEQGALEPGSDVPLEPAGELLMRPLHDEFYQHRENLYARRQLAVNLAKHAARMLAAATARSKAEPAPTVEPAPTSRRSSPSRPARLDAPNQTLQQTKALMLLTPSPEHTERDARVTPEAVVEMAERLGINMSVVMGAEAEYVMMWLAVEAIRAPLPAPWRHVKLDRDHVDGWRAGGVCYEDAITLEHRSDHPLLDAFREQVLYERRRKNRVRPWAHADSWMLFSGAGDVTYYYCFRTHSRSREMPVETLLAKQDTRARLNGGRKQPLMGVGRPLSGESSRGPPGAKTGQRKSHFKKVGSNERQGEGEPRKPIPGQRRRRSSIGPPRLVDERSASQRRQAHQAAGEMKGASTLARQHSLALRPRSLPDLMSAGRALQLNLSEHPDMAWLITLVLCCDYLPIGWADAQLGAANASVDHRSDVSRGLVPEEWLWSPGGAAYGAGVGTRPMQVFNTLSRMHCDQHPVLGFVRSSKKVVLPNDDRTTTIGKGTPQAVDDTRESASRETDVEL